MQNMPQLFNPHEVNLETYEWAEAKVIESKPLKEDKPEVCELGDEECLSCGS